MEIDYQQPTTYTQSSDHWVCRAWIGIQSFPFLAQFHANPITTFIGIVFFQLVFYSPQQSRPVSGSWSLGRTDSVGSIGTHHEVANQYANRYRAGDECPVLWVTGTWNCRRVSSTCIPIEERETAPRQFINCGLLALIATCGHVMLIEFKKDCAIVTHFSQTHCVIKSSVQTHTGKL